MHLLITVAVVLQVISAVAIIVLVLLQHGKGADMGAAFGGGASAVRFARLLLQAVFCLLLRLNRRLRLSPHPLFLRLILVISLISLHKIKFRGRMSSFGSDENGNERKS